MDSATISKLDGRAPIRFVAQHEISSSNSPAMAVLCCSVRVGFTCGTKEVTSPRMKHVVWIWKRCPTCMDKNLHQTCYFMLFHTIMALQLTKLCSRGLHGICSELLWSCHLEVVGLLSSHIPSHYQKDWRGSRYMGDMSASVLQGLKICWSCFHTLHLFARPQAPPPKKKTSPTHPLASKLPRGCHGEGWCPSWSRSISPCLPSCLASLIKCITICTNYACLTISFKLRLWRHNEVLSFHLISVKHLLEFA